MIYIYSMCLMLISPLAIIRLYWKSLSLPAYRERIHERFMIKIKQTDPVDTWVHAVSLGEVIAVTPLVEHLLLNQRKVLLTTMTPTGSQQVLSRFGDRVLHQYLPYDLGWLQKRFFRHYRPRLGLLMETELWPNLIRQANKSAVPLMMVNARVSDRSYPNYLRFSWFFSPLLNQLSLILTQSKADRERFLSLGVNQKKLVQVGNIKFDQILKKQSLDGFCDKKEIWGHDRPVVMFASTHGDEEAQMLQVLPKLQEDIPGVMLLIAPRHPERFETVFEQCVQKGFCTGKASRIDEVSKDTQILIIDKIGELMGWYALCHYAVVGGSFVDVGGHNVLEPISLGKPTLTGPHTQNFREIMVTLEEKNALIISDNMKDLATQLILLGRETKKSEAMVQRALNAYEENTGVVKAIMKHIDGHLSEC